MTPLPLGNMLCPLEEVHWVCEDNQLPLCTCFDEWFTDRDAAGFMRTTGYPLLSWMSGSLIGTTWPNQCVMVYQSRSMYSCIWSSVCMAGITTRSVYSIPNSTVYFSIVSMQSSTKSYGRGGNGLTITLSVKFLSNSDGALHGISPLPYISGWLSKNTILNFKLTNQIRPNCPVG